MAILDDLRTGAKTALDNTPSLVEQPHRSARQSIGSYPCRLAGPTRRASTWAHDLGHPPVVG